MGTNNGSTLEIILAADAAIEVEVGEKSLSGRQLKRYSIWMETIRRNKIF
jgi:hypothetical protein